MMMEYWPISTTTKTKKQIVSIQKNAKPYSEESLPSNGNAQYVIEVNGGWCDKYGIGAGDVVRF